MTGRETRRTLDLDESTRRSSGDGGGGGGAEEAEAERDVRQLEAEVKEMAEKIRNFRRTVPSRLADALSAQLATQRPCLPAEAGMGWRDPSSQDGPGDPRDEGPLEKPELDDRTLLPEADQEMWGRLRILRAKLSANIDATPKILKRINGCIARINRVDKYGLGVHPVFKKRRKI